MNQSVKQTVSNVLVMILGVIVASGIIIVKPWEDSNIKKNILSLGVQEQRDGIKEAIEKGYPRLPSVEEKDGDYSLELYNIMVEEGRLYYEAKVNFPQTKEIILPTLEEQAQQIAKTQAQTQTAQTGGEATKQVSPVEQQQPATAQISQQEKSPATDSTQERRRLEKRDRMKGAAFRVFLIDTEKQEEDYELDVSYESIPQAEGEELVYKINGIISSVDIKNLTQRKKKLVTEVSYFDTQKELEKKLEEIKGSKVPIKPDEGEWNHPLYSFGPILLPVEAGHVFPARHIPLNQEIATEYGSILVDELIVGPSQIAISTRDALEKGYDLAQFEGGRLVDKEGNIYTLKRSYTFPDSPEGKMRFYFNPTDFFDEKTKREYTFQFEDIALNDGRRDRIELSLKDALPKMLEVTGKQVSIVSMDYDEDNKLLSLKLKYNPQEIQLDPGVKGSSFEVFSPAVLAEEKQMDKTSGKSLVTSSTIVPGELKCKVEKENSYLLIIKHNDFFVRKSGELVISEK